MENRKDIRCPKCKRIGDMDIDLGSCKWDIDRDMRKFKLYLECNHCKSTYVYYHMINELKMKEIKE